MPENVWTFQPLVQDNPVYVTIGRKTQSQIQFPTDLYDKQEKGINNINNNAVMINTNSNSDIITFLICIQILHHKRFRHFLNETSRS